MKLLEQIQFGSQTLKNKMVMAAMTRSRAGADGIPTDSMVEYYTQRANAGLILTEAVNISPQALGSPLTPGLFSTAQINGWKKVTDSVHSKGGKIFAQLWHTGRVGHSVDRNGELPVAPSAFAINGMQHFTSQGMKDFETPKELTISEIKQIVKDYVQAAKNAVEAGFDGVELHAANGYLPNQFLSESSNQRMDEYGGTLENRSRFILEIMQGLITAIGGDKVGIKISPFQSYADILQEDPIETYTYLIGELNKLDFAFVELMKKNSSMSKATTYPKDDEVELFGKLIKHSIIANGGYTRQSAENEIGKGIVDLVSFGSLFIANPDLPKRFKLNAELNEVDQMTAYGGGDKGYMDYPILTKK